MADPSGTTTHKGGVVVCHKAAHQCPLFAVTFRAQVDYAGNPLRTAYQVACSIKAPSHPGRTCRSTGTICGGIHQRHPCEGRVEDWVNALVCWLGRRRSLRRGRRGWVQDWAGLEGRAAREGLCIRLEGRQPRRSGREVRSRRRT